MQYFRPDDPKYSVGDCIPFTHRERFHLYYLLDEGHHNHPIVGRLGGHQWAHASSSDLRTWTHHPLAIPLEPDRGEGSICTGSLVASGDMIHAFYALRPYPGGGEFLRMASSHDGISFKKCSEPLFGPPAGFGPDFRDPFLLRDSDDLFHMIVTTRDHRLPKGLDGCLGHWTSRDLKEWTMREPILHADGIPECPDLFEWNGWHYLVFGIDGATVYRMSRTPFGPWLRPKRELVASPKMCVMKTAPWKGGRRIGAAWLPSRDAKGNGLFGGRAVLREILQNPDGTLDTGFVPELEPETGAALEWNVTGMTHGVSRGPNGILLNARNAKQAGFISGLPENFRLKAKVVQKGLPGSFSLLIHSDGSELCRRRLDFLPHDGRVRLEGDHNSIFQIPDIANGSFMLDLIACEDIVDVCINERRTIVDIMPERSGDKLVISADGGEISFEMIKIHPLIHRGAHHGASAAPATKE